MSNNKIYSTTEYGVFNKLRGNRSVNELHVRRLVEAIKEKDLQIPIIVDHDMNVLDGQHRLDAYKIVGNPITYIIKDKFELQDVRNVNSVNRKWTFQNTLCLTANLVKRTTNFWSGFIELMSLVLLSVLRC